MSIGMFTEWFYRPMMFCYLFRENRATTMPRVISMKVVGSGVGVASIYKYAELMLPVIGGGSA